MKLECGICRKKFDDPEMLALHATNQHGADAGEAISPGISDSKLDKLAKRVLWEFLSSDGINPGLLAKAKQANAYRSTEARREQTEGAREATIVMMARELAESKSEFRDFLRIALPGAEVLKAITSGDQNPS